MKPRARRVTLGAAALGAGVVAGLVVFNWITVRDHAEAWWFQLTRDTVEITPAPGCFFPKQDNLSGCLRVLATDSGLPVIHDSALDRFLAFLTMYPSEGITSCLTKGEALRDLRAKGFRVLEQRFPWRAYVVIDPGATP